MVGSVSAGIDWAATLRTKVAKARHNVVVAADLVVQGAGDDGDLGEGVGHGGHALRGDEGGAS